MAQPSSQRPALWPTSGLMKYTIGQNNKMTPMPVDTDVSVESLHIHDRLDKVKKGLTKPNKRVPYTVFCTVIRDIRSSFMHFTFYIESPNTHKYAVLPVTDVKNKLGKCKYDMPAFVLNKCYRLMKYKKSTTGLLSTTSSITDVTLKFTWKMTIEQINTIYELLKIVNDDNTSVFTLDEGTIKTMLIDNREVVDVDV